MNSTREQQRKTTPVHKCDLCLKYFYNNENTLHHLSQSFIRQILQIINIRYWADEQKEITCKSTLDLPLNFSALLETLKITLCNLQLEESYRKASDFRTSCDTMERVGDPENICKRFQRMQLLRNSDF